MFFFKQTTAYEMRLSYWSSDVCSSDLTPVRLARPDTPYSSVPPSSDLPCDRPLNQSAPCTTIGAMLHSDSTLLTPVGRPQADRKSAVSGQSVLIRVNLGVSCIIKQKTRNKRAKHKSTIKRPKIL